MADITFENVEKQFNGTRVIADFSLEVGDGELVVFVGPSGCGKSTLLRMVAGLESISAGNVRIGGRVVNGVNPRQRNVAMVFQNYALYPHMTVGQNLAFPLKMQKMAKSEIREKVEQTAGLLGLTRFLDRRPQQLSGGQRQRVAMGRAIVRDPDVFLMDEPLSNLDAKMRVQIRAEIAGLQRRMKTTTLYVTHDQSEAMTLGERVIVLKEGEIQQAAAPGRLYDAPANKFVAGFIGSPGMNIMPVRLGKGDNHYFAAIGNQQIAIDAERAAQFKDLADFEGSEVLLGLRPEAFAPAGDFPEDRQIRITATTSEMLGHESLLYGDLQSGRNGEGVSIVARLEPDFRVSQGETVVLGIDTGAAHFFHPETGERI